VGLVKIRQKRCNYKSNLLERTSVSFLYGVWYYHLNSMVLCYNIIYYSTNGENLCCQNIFLCAQNDTFINISIFIIYASNVFNNLAGTNLRESRRRRTQYSETYRYSVNS